MRMMLTIFVGALSVACSPAVETTDDGGGTTTGGGTTAVGTTGGGTTGGGVEIDPACLAKAGEGTSQNEQSQNITLDICDGTNVQLAEKICNPDTKVTLVYFGAGWCQPCREKQATLKKWYEKYNKCGLEIVDIISEQDAPNSPVTQTFCQASWKDFYDLPFDVMMDPFNEYTQPFLGGGGAALPIIALVDKDWKIILKQVGSDDNTLEPTIKALTGCN